MFLAAISTLALGLAIGPQIQMTLQAALEEPAPAVEMVEETSEIEPILEEEVLETAPVVESVPAEVTPAATESDEVEPEASESESSVEADQDEPAAVELAEPAPQAETTPEVQSGALSEAEWPAVLAAASASLSAAETARGNFIQSNPDGSVTTGTFALNRPGRMRFDYDDPTPVLIVSDGTTVAMEDSELETVDRVPIGATPLGLILSTDLNVDEDVDVLGVMENAERYGIRVQDASGELEGTLTMVFAKTSFDLLGWLATDGNFRTTVVDLTDVETNVRIDPRLFRLDDAQDEEEER